MVKTRKKRGREEGRNRERKELALRRQREKRARDKGIRRTNEEKQRREFHER